MVDTFAEAFVRGMGAPTVLTKAIGVAGDRPQFFPAPCPHPSSRALVNHGRVRASLTLNLKFSPALISESFASPSRPSLPSASSPMQPRFDYLLSQMTQDFDFEVQLAQRSLDPEMILKRVLTWTDGQPVLTEHVCRMLLSASRTSSNPCSDPSLDHWVDTFIQTYCIDRCVNPELRQHIRSICRSILTDGRSQSLLRLYQTVLAGKPQDVNLQNPVQQRLLQLGLVQRHQGQLILGNRIYHSIFDAAWVDRAFRTLSQRPTPKPLPPPPPPLLPANPLNALTPQARGTTVHSSQLPTMHIQPTTIQPQHTARLLPSRRPTHRVKPETPSLWTQPSLRWLGFAFLACVLGAVVILGLTLTNRDDDTPVPLGLSAPPQSTLRSPSK